MKQKLPRDYSLTAFVIMPHMGLIPVHSAALTHW